MATASGASHSSNASSSSSHMLKTGRRGNPFCKDTHDLFATLMVSLTLSTNTRLFRSYPNTFTTDDAAANLASLRFSQSNRTPDPNDPSRIVTTTTTTTFSMSRDIAKGICQHFLDAHLIVNVVDPEVIVFRDRGIFGITPKGLHVLERFITKNGIAADHIVRVFAAQPILVHLITLERRTADDEIDLSRRMLEYVWRRFSGGKHPNYIVPSSEAQRAATLRRAQPLLDSVKEPPGFERSRGIELQDTSERAGGKEDKSFTVVRQVFNASAAVDWMVDFSTCVCRDEAAELIAHFVRLGLIVMHTDKSKPGDKLVVVEARADPNAKSLAGGATSAELRWGPRISYRFTDEGRKLAGSDQPPPLHAAASASSVPMSKPLELRGSSEGTAAGTDDDASSVHSGSRGPVKRTGGGLTDALDVQLMSRRLVDLFRGDLGDAGNWAKEQHSSTARLKAILDEPALRALFREYLRSNYCEENLGFWLDVADFRRRFSTTSSASGGTPRPSSHSTARKEQASASSAMEVHQQHLVNAAMQIYHTYLAPLSPNELNIDHNLRADVVNFINKASLDNAQSATPAMNPKSPSSPAGSRNASLENSPDPNFEPSETTPVALRATQVQALLRHYERIQDHIFRLLATDQVPKFIRTPRFMELLEMSRDQEGMTS